MRKAIGLVAITAWLLVQPGCGIFQGSQEAVSYKTLKSVQLTVDALMKTYGTAVVTGKVSPEKQLEIDMKHATYRGAFRLAVTAARNDLSTTPPTDLQQLANELQLLISSL